MGCALCFRQKKKTVQKSHLLMKPTTLGTLRVRATIVHSLVKDSVIFAIVFHYAVIAAAE